MSQFDHEAVQGTDLSGDNEEEQDELQDAELDAEGAAKVADTVDDLAAPGEAATSSESSTSEE